MLAFLAIEAHLEGDLEVATNRAAEALDVGTSCGLLHVTAESRRVLALVASKRGQHAEAEHLLEDAADAYEQVGDRWQLALVLKDRANAALERGNAALALESLREALRLARDIGSGERMSDAIGTAVRALWHCGRAREAAALLGAADAMSQSLPRDAERLQTRLAPVAAAIASAGLDAHRVAGRRLSVERATDLALRAIDEALVATAGEA